MPRPKNSKPSKPTGRPATQRTSRTMLARWMAAYGMRTADLHAKCLEICEAVGLTPSHVPSLKSLADIALGRYQPNAAVLLILRHVTNGEVDLEHWVRDLFTGNSQNEKVASRDSHEVHAIVCHPPMPVPVVST